MLYISTVNLIFEDSDEMPISKLIKDAYDCDKVVSYFACGNSMSPEFFGRIENKQATTIIFCDVVPDNVDTGAKYVNICKSASGIFDNFYVYPILCIEYIFLTVFKQITSLASEYGEALCGDKISADSLCGKSFEKLCKRCLNEYSKTCMRNKWNKHKTNAFYTGDCLCFDRRKDCITLTYQSKCTELVVGLGIFYQGYLRHKYTGKYKTVSYEQSLKTAFQHYSNLCEKYERSGLKISNGVKELLKSAIRNIKVDNTFKAALEDIECKL